MHLLIINPNTSTEMTEQIDQTAAMVAAPNTEVTTICPSSGPESLESFYEYHLATVATLEAVEEYTDDVDGVIIACYGDPGLYPLKEIVDVPVVGVAEASMATATMLGHRFSILAALDRAVAMMENLVQWYGLSDRLASVEPTGLSVLELEEDEERTMTELVDAGVRAKRQSHAEVFILGCSGMSGYEEQLAEELGSPVIDPVQAAVTTIEGLHRQGISQSDNGLWAKPPEKDTRGELTGDWYLAN